MSIRRSILAVALALAALFGLLVPVPASADHMGTFGEWVYPPTVKYSGYYAANIQDAAYYWEDLGFDGYYPPLPQFEWGACDRPREGVIMVCSVSRSTVNFYACNWSGACGQNVDGYTYNWWYSGTDDIFASMVLVAGDLSQYARQQVYRHEMGHALGLGHTSDTSCVMHRRANVPPGTVCYHDASAIANLYPGDDW